MKKNLAILLSSLVVISLISCNKPQTHSDSKSNIDQSIEDTSVVTSSESSIASSIELSSSIDESTTSSEEETYYHVTFVNYDDSLLYEVDVLEGSAATYSGETPTKEEDDEFTYTFIGWDKEEELTSITSNVTAKAQYDPVAKENWGPIIWF